MAEKASAADKTKYKAPDYCSGLLDNLYTLWQEDQFCDVNIEVENTNFHAHHIVLAAGCPYFKAMFTSGMSEQNSVTFHDISPDVFKCILEFLYTGEVTITEENCQDLLSAADMFDVEDVVRLCSTFLRQRLHSQNCIGVYLFAEAHSCKELKHDAEKFLTSNFLDVAKEDEFYQLPKETLVNLLFSEYLNIDDEFQVFQVAMDWILHSPVDRRKYIFDIMTPIRFPIISKQDLDKFISECKDLSCKVAIQKNLQDFHFDRKTGLKYKINKTKPYIFQPRKSARKNILVVGGFQRSKEGRWSDAHSLTSVEEFDTYSLHWKTIPTIQYPRSSHGVAYFNGQVYALGGEHDSLIYDTVEIYDPLIQKWSMGPSMKMPRCGLGVCATNDCLYAIGGWVGMELGDTIEEFDPSTETWRIIDKMLTPRFAAGVTELDGLIYIIGGMNTDDESGSEMSIVESFNPVTKEWQRLADMHTKRAYIGVASCNGFVYAVGGFNEVTGDLTCVERYSPEKDEWTELPPMLVKRSAPSVVMVNGLLYVLGGRHWVEKFTSYSAPITLNSVECFDPVTSCWMDVCPMPTSRAEAGAVVL